MQILNILKSTPVYVYLLLCYLIFIGVRATKTRIVSSPIKLFIMPAVFSLFSLKAILSVEHFMLLILIATISFFVSQNLLKPPAVQITSTIITVPGSWQPLLTIICIFLVKYYFSYLKATIPEVAQQYNVMDLAISGIIIGFTFFKAWFYYKHYIDKIKKIE